MSPLLRLMPGFSFAACLAYSAPLNYTLIQYPGAATTTAYGINNNGDVVGTYFNSTGLAHGFLLTASGVFSSLGPIAASVPLSINDAGQVVGFYASNYPFTAFERSPTGTYTSAGNQSFSGISDNGYISGYTSAGLQNFIIDPSGKYTYFTEPNITNYPSAFTGGVNQAGVVVGSYTGNYNTPIGSGSGQAGYIRDAQGNFTSVVAPGCVGTTSLNGINDSGLAVGSCNSGAGFIYNSAYTGPAAGAFQFVTIPGLGSPTLNGISDNGALVGSITVNGVQEGILIQSAIPEPGTLLIAGSGLVAIGVILIRRKFLGSGQAASPVPHG